MPVRLAELEGDPDRPGDILARLRDGIEASVAREAGVLALQAAALRDRPGAIPLLEAYADPEACAARLRSPRRLACEVATEGLVRSLRLIGAAPVLLRARTGSGAASATGEEPG